ncbi:Autophagy protein 22 [Pleurotus ostreatus]|uniref:Autophagy-related protein n=1 Tax=Pleurotus ostreatus TaxID=5322 RepID=A0A8H6ZLU0_PLEOS|nr:Autophagy protein 22 [Pleurotus ostreatus]KAF7416303.1 Autophagy protein 22 [Pleurotus ostreatus]KAJ8689178.1 Autophagy protein 22 [Pleurotus ostreatus]
MIIEHRGYQKQLWGWLSYAFASEVFVIVSLTLFLPICLEQFARDNGYQLPDMTEQCLESTRCVVRIGWMWVDTASFSLYVNSISVALQALTVISMGGIADHPPHRKRLLLSFAFIGATSAILFLLLPSSSSLWLLAAPLAMLANVGFGASVVAMNAYLPTLARESPEVQAKLHDNDDEAPLLPSDDQPNRSRTYDEELSRATARISSFGIALGYAAGITLLVVALFPVTKLRGSTFSLRLSIGLSGIWWALFSIPAALWLPGATGVEQPWSARSEIAASWKRLGGMLHPREIQRLKNTFKYLGAWFLLSDGFTTITSTAILFGKTSLHMQPSALIVVGALTPACGIGGSVVWPMLQRRYGWSNKQILVALVLLVSAVPAYGCLGFLGVFDGERVRFGGLTTVGEMFALAVYFGFVYGAFQGYARALYAELLPAGEEARWYGLYSITDKSSSFVGPLVVGVISDATGNIRYAFFFLVVMIWLAVPLLLSVDVEEGRRDARKYKYGSSQSVDDST